MVRAASMAGVTFLALAVTAVGCGSSGGGVTGGGGHAGSSTAGRPGRRAGRDDRHGG